MLNWKSILAGIVFVASVIVLIMAAGINDAGYRTVVQYPNGTLKVVFKAGWYWKWFGETTKYKDVITFDFDRNKNGAGGTLDEPGIGVRYQDGGTGTIYGLARFRLPSDEVDMLKIHKDFRSNSGIAYKLLKNTTEETMNNTAGLMTSEDSYANKRSTFTQWAKDQLTNGKYVTKLQTITTTEDGMDSCLDNDNNLKQTDNCKDVKVTTRDIPVIAYGKNGTPQHLTSDLHEYNISISTFNIIDWTYEQKTLDQIAAKRQATMAIITAKANAERAKQDAITEEQEGLARVVKAKYEKEVDKQKAVVEADQAKEVAVIKAKQQVEVAQQGVLAATQDKLAAAQYKQQQTLIGEGDAARRAAVMKADGALGQKLAAYVEVQKYYADAIAKYQGAWVPSVMMGGSGNGAQVNGAQQLINLLSVKTAKDLALDLGVTGNTAVAQPTK